MMTGCGCGGLAREFDVGEAARSLASFRASGPGDTARGLAALLKQEGVAGMTVLDVGGGIGAVQYELLRAGAVGTVNVEASPAFADAAEAEIRRRGMARRMTVHRGDFVALASSIAREDIVTLDRVICCYADMSRLVGLSVAHARELYGLVYPRDTCWVRTWIALRNCRSRLRGNPFRLFLHSPGEVDSIVRAAGLRRRRRVRTWFWEIVIYARPSPSRSSTADVRQARGESGRT